MAAQISRYTVARYVSPRHFQKIALNESASNGRRHGAQSMKNIRDVMATSDDGEGFDIAFGDRQTGTPRF
jgi:hypothetical protein